MHRLMLLIQLSSLDTSGGGLNPCPRIDAWNQRCQRGDDQGLAHCRSVFNDQRLGGSWIGISSFGARTCDYREHTRD